MHSAADTPSIASDSTSPLRPGHWAPATLYPHISPSVKGTSLPLCIGRRSKSPSLRQSCQIGASIHTAFASCGFMLLSLHRASHGAVFHCFSLSFDLFAFPCSCHGPLISFGELGCNSGWLWEGPALFPLGRPSTKSLLPSDIFIPSPTLAGFPAFLTLSHPSRKDPGPP